MNDKLIKIKIAVCAPSELGGERESLYIWVDERDKFDFDRLHRIAVQCEVAKQKEVLRQEVKKELLNQMFNGLFKIV